MNNLPYLEEFKTEAAGASFTKQQAVSATLTILQKEKTKSNNSPSDTKVFDDALKKAEFKYIDATSTETDVMLDSLGVARFSCDDIVKAINDLIFDVK